ncbi:MAG: ABC transporter ATP-binding protein [Deltaproteobacteria bacterium]|nr:ABC transporter ATP-binding protein [Deltaproteobacteria bacterium]
MKLEINGLKKIFINSIRGNLLVLDGVNLKIASGEFVSIIGPSGCGKTTLIEIIAGLQQKTDGEILIDQLPIEKSPSNCAIVFQQYALFPWLTVQKNIEYGLKIRKIDKKERNNISRKYIGLVGLNSYKKYYPHELSGGMQQRVALARALANAPDILLLDEPFAALDAQTREDCQRELLRLWQQIGITIVFVTHDIGEAILLSDRVFVMSSNPGTIKTVIDINLKRPRESSVRVEKTFRVKEMNIRNLLNNGQGEVA